MTPSTKRDRIARAALGIGMFFVFVPLLGVGVVLVVTAEKLRWVSV